MPVDADGFLRLSPQAVFQASFVHFVSGLDHHECTEPCGSPAQLSGYTEWLSRTAPLISLGWDWRIEAGSQLVCLRCGPPRSNVLFVDEAMRDLDWKRNLEVLGNVVDALAWSQVTARAIAVRYR
ncbi:MAG: hypothetical protein JWQ73_3847 [Variovorax sp.]|nr:hypothetical protein [Variovorax sp.]